MPPPGSGDILSQPLDERKSKIKSSMLLGGKAKVVACPGAPAGTLAVLSTDGSPSPVCATNLRMMPSARAEIFIPGSIAQGQAILRTVHRSTGIDGDD
jgi:hypothetical protein